MRQIYWALLLSLFASSCLANGLRCGKRVVSLGAHQFEVRAACGEPDITVVLNSAYTIEYSFLPYEEEWQYNFGPSRLMRFVRFRNKRLSGVETGSRGFSVPSERCDPNELSEGLPLVELLGRCGAPDLVERRLAERIYTLGPPHPVFPIGTPVEDWIYEFDPSRFYRIVTVIEGKVIQIVTGDRRKL